jgi:hypothetical protein
MDNQNDDDEQLAQPYASYEPQLYETQSDSFIDEFSQTFDQAQENLRFQDQVNHQLQEHLAYELPPQQLQQSHMQVNQPYGWPFHHTIGLGPFPSAGKFRSELGSSRLMVRSDNAGPSSDNFPSSHSHAALHRRPLASMQHDNASPNEPRSSPTVSAPTPEDPNVTASNFTPAPPSHAQLLGQRPLPGQRGEWYM